MQATWNDPTPNTVAMIALSPASPLNEIGLKPTRTNPMHATARLTISTDSRPSCDQ